ncbi:MAG: 23S rRNA (pseudouridine(1915)-N(3))-methyltransferase RlmH [Deltaproteobacteria bacterium]|nr:23S rRNA (pseudouridine(1915)-N(3))-methyltransferase RlmH [Deltaproteobacteria bacterium]RLB65640.1 MAG: 23S rRNA (pseudouridine(1915)-N(3))-methyltransferase RlmH [Deltaproteobacteria bacterium]
MRLNLLCIGRLSLPYLNQGCAEFAERLKRYRPLSITEIKEHKTGRKQDLQRIIAAEGANLEQRIPSGSYVIALDQRGKSLSSEKLAELMNNHMVQGIPEWTLLIGGPYGLSESLRKRADLVLSMSAMTLTHQMARLLLLEQLYRCCTIIRNEPYHH